MAKDDELDKILDEVKDYQTSGSGQVIHEVDFSKFKLAIKAYTEREVQQAVAERDSVWIKTQEMVRKADISNIINDQEPN